MFTFLHVYMFTFFQAHINAHTHTHTVTHTPTYHRQLTSLLDFVSCRDAVARKQKVGSGLGEASPRLSVTRVRIWRRLTPRGHTGCGELKMIPIVSAQICSICFSPCRVSVVVFTQFLVYALEAEFDRLEVETNSQMASGWRRSSLVALSRMEVLGHGEEHTTPPRLPHGFTGAQFIRKQKYLWRYCRILFLGFSPSPRSSLSRFQCERDTRHHSSSSVLKSRISQSATQTWLPTVFPQRKYHKNQETHFVSIVRRCVPWTMGDHCHTSCGRSKDRPVNTVRGEDSLPVERAKNALRKLRTPTHEQAAK